VQLRHIIDVYLVCLCAEGRSRSVVRQYQDVLYSLLDFTGDMNALALSNKHARRYMGTLTTCTPAERRRHEAVLRFFGKWLFAQRQAHRPAYVEYRPPRRKRRTNYLGGLLP
jgi:hypothetical protein